MNQIARTLLVPVALATAACSAAPPPEPAVAQASLTAADAPHVPGPCSIVYESDATIKGTVDQVWDTLTNLPNYGAWNPWVVSASGNLTPGGAVTVQVILN